MNCFPYSHISVLVMPTDFCNMNCVYCFNGRKTCKEKKVISDETLKKVFQIVIPFYSEVKFIWHGGEPLSMGMEFYERVVELQNEFNINNISIQNTVQTNLTLLDKKFADFLVENNFHVGSSFDGIMQNEATRHNTDRILKGHEILKSSGGRNGFICVVQNKNIDYLVDDYEWFKSKKINYTHNMYLTDSPQDNELFVPEDKYVSKMCDFFDYWMFDKRCNIRVSYFETFIKYILHKEKDLCCYNSCMGKHIGIHFDGSIFGCNRDFPDEYCFGNVYDYEDIHECFRSDGFNSLLSKAVKRRNHCREVCDIYDFCAGGCNSTALAGGNIEKNNEYICETMRAVYKYIEEKVEPWREEREDRIRERLNPYLVEMLIKK
mgnify:FL=1